MRNLTILFVSLVLGCILRQSTRGGLVVVDPRYEGIVRARFHSSSPLPKKGQTHDARHPR